MTCVRYYLPHHHPFSMSATETATRSQTGTGNAARGATRKGGNHRRGRNQNVREVGRGGKPQETLPPMPQPETVQKEELVPEPAEDSDEDVCWICAEPVKYYSVSECNHRTCHICALRLRALYRKTDCTFCKVRKSRFLWHPLWVKVIN